jgi:SAM-dependent methyltransferase
MREPEENLPDFDPLARPYRWLEYLTLGPYLERCRFHWLPRLADCRQALVYGDGDGRFLARLMTGNGRISADAVDSSAAMLQLLNERIARIGSAALARLATHQADARHFAPPRTDYDLVAAHFFLDCFTDQELDEVLERAVPCLAPCALAVISDFAIPASGPGSLLARMIVGFLYRVFGLVTGLRTRSLPDYRAALRGRGFRLEARQTWLGGLLVSELWRLQDRSTADTVSLR